MNESLRERLRRTPALTGPLPVFEPGRAGPDPGPVFVDWLEYALDDGVPEPQVMNLSTADSAGRPSSRVLILRDVDPADCSFVFASDAGSRKGQELAANPYAALTWYWPRHGRQIRAAGPVQELDPGVARSDFLGRSEASRTSGFTGRMSASLGGAADYEEQRRQAAAHVAADPEAVPDGHTVYRLRAQEVEFFQGDPGRFHLRLRYLREDRGWARGLLWP